MKISEAARNAACNAIVDLVDAGADPGYIAFRSGAAPASPGDPDAGTLLATLDFNDPAFGNAGAVNPGEAILDVDPAISDTVDSSGTVEHFRIKDSDDTTILQGSCGLAACDINFDAVAWLAGGTVSSTGLTVTVPE